MGRGTLPIERFKEYLVQDYLYLVRTIQSWCLSVTNELNP